VWKGRGLIKGVYDRIERNLVQLDAVSKRKITYTCVLDKLEHGTTNSYTPKDHVGTYSVLAGFDI
jgi:hypothetical protein